LSKIKQLPVPVPPLAEQEAIVERIEGQLSLLDNANSLSARALAKAAALRRSLLHRAFTGRLVPQDPDDEPASVLLDRIRAERGAQSVKPQRKRRARARVSGSVGPSPAPEAKPIPADAVQQELPL
jgi:type I restriction enzyme S subunit